MVFELAALLTRGRFLRSATAQTPVCRGSRSNVEVVVAGNSGDAPFRLTAGVVPVARVIEIERLLSGDTEDVLHPLFFKHLTISSAPVMSHPRIDRYISFHLRPRRTCGGIACAEGGGRKIAATETGRSRFRTE